VTTDRDELRALVEVIRTVSQHSPNVRYSSSTIPAALERASRYLSRPTFGEERTLAAAEERGRERGVRPFRDLFAGGPDTSCRTTWRFDDRPYADRVECVEVPLDDLRAAFVETGEVVE
jgi:hypothetical protein